MLRKHCWYYRVGVPTNGKMNIRDGILYSQSPKALILKFESRGFTVIEIRHATTVEYKKYIIETRINDLESFDVPSPRIRKFHPRQIVHLTLKYLLLICFLLLSAYFASQLYR